MTIKRVWIEDTCIGCGNSEFFCPELFKIDRDIGMATVIEGVELASIEDRIKEAAECCPVDAIKYEEGDA